jgi:hypothetical protein
MANHHLIITGTGRSGTTFLVQLLTKLGLETGFVDPNSKIFANCNAGMEHDLRKPGAPYIVKHPGLCDYLDALLESKQVVIDHAIIPIRDLYQAAESRRHVVYHSRWDIPPDDIPGGLVHTRKPNEQEAILAQRLYKIIYTISKYDIPTTFLFYPKLVQDPDYLYQKLAGVLPKITYDAFLEAFQAVCRPELVHDFKKNSSIGQKGFLAQASMKVAHACLAPCLQLARTIWTAIRPARTKALEVRPSMTGQDGE